MSTKIDPELVLSTLLSFYGGDDGEFESLAPFCRAAREPDLRLFKRDEYAGESAVLYAAACAAYEKICYHKCLAGNGISSLSVGDVSAVVKFRAADEDGP